MKYRRTEPTDIERTYSVRARTRQNAMSRAQLISAGFDPESVSRSFSNGEFVGWVCEAGTDVVGFATGNTRTGEVLVVAVLPEYEGQGIGKTLLSLLVGSMTEQGCSTFWLQASPDPDVRAHGFYRANGWAPSGRRTSSGDEILELVSLRAPPP